MLKPSISLLLLLSFGAFADNALFPEADQVDPLIRYQKKDRTKQPLFYDEIVLKTAGKFVSYANANMVGSTRDSLMDAYVGAAR